MSKGDEKAKRCSELLVVKIWKPDPIDVSLFRAHRASFNTKKAIAPVQIKDPDSIGDVVSNDSIEFEVVKQLLRANPKRTAFICHIFPNFWLESKH
jgi:hypothetical protein